MQLADREVAEISKHITDAEAILAVLPQKPSQITAELGLGVIRSALFALDESAADAPWAARTLQKLRLALATLNVPSEVHEHVRDALRALRRNPTFALVAHARKRHSAEWKPHAWSTRGTDNNH